MANAVDRKFKNEIDFDQDFQDQENGEDYNDDNSQQNDEDNQYDSNNQDEDGDKSVQNNSSKTPKFIRLRGLPWSATHQEILSFLKNVNVVNGSKSIHLVTSRIDGKNTGEAYVEVASQEDVDEARELNKASMGHRYIEVFTATPKEAKEAMRKTNGHGASFVVKLRGLPYAVTEQQVEEFFTGLEIKTDREGILFVMDRRGRATGEAFVQFESQDDTEQALGRNREKIGHRYIEVFRSSIAEMKRATSGSGGRPGPYDIRDRGANRGGNDFGGGRNDWGNNNSNFGVGANNMLGFNNLPSLMNSGNFGNNAGNQFGQNSPNFGNNGGGNFGNFGNNGGGNFGNNGGGNFGTNVGGGGNFGNNIGNNFGNNGGGNFGQNAGAFNQNTGNFGINSGGNFGNNGAIGFNGNNGNAAFGGNNRFNNGGNSGNFGNDFGDFNNFGNNRINNANNGGNFGNAGNVGNFGNNMGGGGFGNFGNNGGGNFGNNGMGGGNIGSGGNIGGGVGGGGVGGGFNNGNNFGGGVAGGGNFGPIGGRRNNDVEYYTIHMRGLPYTSFENDVFKFFEPIHPANVRINYTKKGLHSGTADAYFDTYDDSQLAMKRHREQMGSRYIELFYDGKSRDGINIGGGGGGNGGGGGGNNKIGMGNNNGGGFSRRI